MLFLTKGRNYVCCEKDNKLFGFSLVELMVVISIIALLATLALPAFSLFRSRAYDASALSHSHTIITFEDGYFVDHMDYIPLPAVLGDPVAPHPMAAYGAPHNIGFQLGVPRPGTLVCYVGHLHGTRWFGISRSGTMLMMFRKVVSENPASAAQLAPVDTLLTNTWGASVQ